MSYGLIDYNTLHNISNVIRYKTNSGANYYPREMATAINAIQSGGNGFDKPVIPSFSMFDGNNVIFDRSHMSEFVIRNEMPNIDTNNGEEFEILEDFYWTGISPDNVYFYKKGFNNNNCKEYGLLVNNRWSPNDVSIMDMSNVFCYTSNMLNAFCGPYTRSLKNAYFYCYKLFEPVCGENVVDMTNAYCSCSNLVNSVCGNNVKYMFSAFSSGTNIKYGKCGPNVVYMANAYSSCSNMTDLEIGDNVKDISNVASGCYNLKNIICNRLTSVVNAPYAFNGCNNLIDIPSDIRMLEEAHYMFSNCQNISQASYNNFIQNAYHIKNATGMFMLCKNLTYGEIPENVICADNMYTNCTNLETAIILSPYVNAMNNTFAGSSITDAVYSDIVTNYYQTYNECHNLVNISYTDNMINMYCTYANCYSLENGIVGPNVVSAYGMFQECNGLKHVNIMSHELNYVEYMFYNCRNLVDDIYVGPNIKELSSMLRYCDNVKNIYIANATLNAYRYSIANGMQRSVFTDRRNIIIEHRAAWNNFVMYNGAGNMSYTNETYAEPVEVNFNGSTYNAVRCAYNINYNTYIYCEE